MNKMKTAASVATGYLRCRFEAAANWFRWTDKSVFVGCTIIVLIVFAIAGIVGSGIWTTHKVHVIAVRTGMNVRRDTSVYVNHGNGVIVDTAKTSRTGYMYMNGPSLDRIISISVPAPIFSDMAFASARFDTVIETKDSVYVVSWSASSVFRPVSGKLRWVRTY